MPFSAGFASPHCYLVDREYNTTKYTGRCLMRGMGFVACSTVDTPHSSTVQSVLLWLLVCSVRQHDCVQLELTFEFAIRRRNSSRKVGCKDWGP